MVAGHDQPLAGARRKRRGNRVPVSANGAGGGLDGDLILVDYAANAAAYGCRTYRVSTLDELRAALADAARQSVSTLIDVKVLPKTMSRSYGAWWRVGAAGQPPVLARDY